MYSTATGLIYVGNGQYYDPATGRFLTRDAQPGQFNPNLPNRGDPTGLLIGPLALLVLVRKRKGKGNSKVDQWLVLLLVSLAVGITVTGCGPKPSPTPTPLPEPTPTKILPAPQVWITHDPTATSANPTATSAPVVSPIPTTPSCPYSGPGGIAYITIDDGPGGFTDGMLNVLDQHGVKATFFVVGQYVQSKPDEVRRMQTRGDAIGIHSWSHPKTWGALTSDEQKDQIDRTQSILSETIGKKSNLFRAPGGGLTSTPISDLYNYNWTVNSYDADFADTYSGAGKDDLWFAQTVSNNVFSGSSDSKVFSTNDQTYTQNFAIDNTHWSRPIILIHSTHSFDPLALDLIIQGLKDRNYTFGALPRACDPIGTGTPITDGN